MTTSNRVLRRIPGGCDDCDAYSELVDTGGNVFVLAVRHDDSCPALYRVVRRRTA